ncbi:MAG: energy-coupling factor transporter transmembrane protein EcfT [Clostridia bacterium]|nr:energy-coupling factor transporter transmembrane protein EcfT [Clostridia bacterium]
MISDITLGQFFPGKSVIHRLDPRTKIILSIVFIVAVFMANTPAAFLLLTVGTVLTVVASKLSFSVIFKGIKPIIYILIFTAIINIFLTKGTGEPLVSFWIINIYVEGIVRAFFMAYRVIILIIGTSTLLTYTTSPIALTDGIESLLYPLKLLHVPVHLFAMMMTIALRFIPTLIEETEKIMNAQKSRGADFTSGGLIKRAKALIPILIPLFVSSFKRAEELATAMECRCYRGDKNRTKLVKLSFKGIDLIWALFAILFIGGVIALRIIPQYFPENITITQIMFYYI